MRRTSRVTTKRDPQGGGVGGPHRPGEGVVPLGGLVHPREPVPAALALRRQVHGDHLHGRGADEAPGRYGIGALEGGAFRGTGPWVPPFGWQPKGKTSTTGLLTSEGGGKKNNAHRPFGSPISGLPHSG